MISCQSKGVPNYNRSMRGLRKTISLLAVRIGVATALLLAPSLAAAQEIVTLATRDGVTQSFLLVAPKENKPAAAAVSLSRRNRSLPPRARQRRIEIRPWQLPR